MIGKIYHFLWFTTDLFEIVCPTDDKAIGGLLVYLRIGHEYAETLNSKGYFRLSFGHDVGS